MDDSLNWLDLYELLTNYTFRTMIIGTAIVGAAAGFLGCFLYLKRQTMISDVIGHSAITGVGLGFILFAGVLGLNGRSMLVLTVSSALTAIIAVLMTNLITARSSLSPDAAMAVTLSLFFGGGMVLMRWITYSGLPNRGGIEKYVFGNAATMTADDVVVIGAIATGALLVVSLLWKEFKIFTFDPVLAQTLGFRAQILEPIMLVTITTGVVIGIKAVGLILMVGFVILPAAAARQWARSLALMATISTLIGGLGGALGSVLAVQLGKVPTGPIIIMVLFVTFVISFLVAPERSVLAILLNRRQRTRLGRVAE